MLRASPVRRCLSRLSLVLLFGLLLSSNLPADETRLSPYVPKLVGQEDFLYVWTQGVAGWGDGSDKLVTIGARPEAPGYGQVVSTLSVGGRHGAMSGGLSADRRELWVGGVTDDAIFVFDVSTNPAEPELAGRIEDFGARSSGVAGPNTFTALPDRMLISGLSNVQTGGPRTGLVELDERGRLVRTTWMPDGAPAGFDLAVNTRLNRVLTSSFTGRKRDAPPETRAADPRSFGTLVVWELSRLKPLQILPVPGAPLAVRWAHGPRHDYAFVATTITARLWGVFRTDAGGFEAVDLTAIGDPASQSLPVDASLSSDDRFLFVAGFGDGTARVFDVSEPRSPRLVHERRVAPTLGYVAQSWDGYRVYFTSGFLPAWTADGEGETAAGVCAAFAWDGAQLAPLFRIDFREEGLGRPRSVHFGSIDFHRGRVAGR